MFIQQTLYSHSSPELRITNYVSEALLKGALRITNYELRITNYELRITNYELRITNYPNY
ncbi:MAG: alpha/beta hydrolase [Sphaerospermopsis sp. SIO1G1]|nr:alpha/beta hydrolase [Sphaerospermopsis sp. SIO1G1]